MLKQKVFSDQGPYSLLCVYVAFEPQSWVNWCVKYLSPSQSAHCLPATPAR